MACFSIATSNGFLIAHDKLGFCGGKTKSLRRCERFCHNRSLPFASMMGFRRFYNPQNGFLGNVNLSLLVNNGYSRVSPFGLLCGCYNLPNGLPCEDEIETLRSGNNGDNKQAYLGRGDNSRVRMSRRRSSLRLRPRLRLLTIRMKRASIRSLLNDVGAFLRNHTRKVMLSAALSFALGLCYMFLKITALPSPKMVPYSDLIASLQNGSVTNVLLEEGSRRIYYNTKLQSVEEAGMSGGESTAISLPNENVANKVARVSKPVQPANVNVLKKFSRKQASTPEWQYATRKVDHDEEFLLSLMREKGTIYSSAPQSVLMSMRSTLITVITLWIPLIPLMWLLYRQLSAANSPARKRKRDLEMVGFDDVEGVDAAKVELMEVRVPSFEIVANMRNISCRKDSFMIKLILQQS